MIIEEFIEKNEIRSIAVYGMSEKGKKLYTRLQEVSPELTVIGIDKLNYQPMPGYQVIHLLEDELPELDAIVIIPESELDFIKWELDCFVSSRCCLISLGELESLV